jgi:hypothetical protein
LDWFVWFVSFVFFVCERIFFMPIDQAFELGLTEYSATDTKGKVGSLRYEGAKVYKVVQNKTGSAAVAGNVANYHPASDTTFTFKKVYAPATANLNLLAGVWLAATPADSYGWIQIGGVNTTTNVLGHASLAIGGNLIGVDGQLYLTYGTASGTAPAYTSRATSLAANTTTTGTTAQAVALNCIF